VRVADRRHAEVDAADGHLVAPTGRRPGTRPPEEVHAVARADESDVYGAIYVTAAFTG
jgi:hypothetical protein